MKKHYLPVKLLFDNELPESINNVVLSYTIFDVTDTYEDEIVQNTHMNIRVKHGGYEKYYVPDQSKLPIYAAFSMFVLIMGAAGTINAVGTEDSISKYVLYFGLALMGGTLFFGSNRLFKSIAGLDSTQLNQSFVYGMAWFIFSEVMFFAAFFGALFYVRTFSVPWLGEKEKGLANMLCDFSSNMASINYTGSGLYGVQHSKQEYEFSWLG